MTRSLAPIIGLSLGLSILAGCGSAQRYELVAPRELRGPVPMNVGQTFARDGIEYEAFQVEDKLVVRFVNRTSGPLRLTGASVLVDARGRAFAVEAQTLAPDQSGRVLMPPGLADEVRPGERRPIASEVRVGGVDEGGIIRPRDDNVARPEPATSDRFQWRSGQVARLTLAFDAAGKAITHVWTVRRK